MTSFTRTLHAEWTKFRTVRGLVLAMLLLPVLTIGFSAFTTSSPGCPTVTGATGQPISTACSAITGPGGEPVLDQFFFLHRGLAARSSITAAVTALTGTGLQPWGKAGIMIKASTRPGSAYAAMLVTGAHGVRFQWNYTQDEPGLPGNVSAGSPRWLRLVRDGDTVTGYDSADAVHWTEVGVATLTGLPATAQAGLFAANPLTADGSVAPFGPATALLPGSTVTAAGGATGRFAQVSLAGAVSGGWTGSSIGSGPAAPPGAPVGAFALSDSSNASGSDSEFAVNGSGDIAPDLGFANGGQAIPVSQTLDGVFIGLIVAIIIGAVFITAEYRRGLIRVTLTATPARGQVLAAKAVVIGAVTFVAAVIGCAISLSLGIHLLRAHGTVLAPVPAGTALRLVIGTAVIFAAAAVLAVALGAMFRRGAAAVGTAIVLVVLPWFLAVAAVVPVTAADWLLRICPAAAFAVQQTLRQYPQVMGDYTPLNGFFPLPSWAGLAVLCGWIAAALWLAACLLRRRDV